MAGHATGASFGVRRGGDSVHAVSQFRAREEIIIVVAAKRVERFTLGPVVGEVVIELDRLDVSVSARDSCVDVERRHRHLRKDGTDVDYLVIDEVFNRQVGVRVDQFERNNCAREGQLSISAAASSERNIRFCRFVRSVATLGKEQSPCQEGNGFHIWHHESSILRINSERHM